MNTQLPPRRADQAYDVVVVGAGPTGLVLATLLADAGTSVAIVDPAAVACHHPRASHIDDETMRTLQAFGAADEDSFLRHEGHEVQNANGDVLVSMLMNGPRTDQGWWSDYQFHQPAFESRLRGRLADADRATLWLGWRGVELRQDSDGVVLSVESTRTGERHVLTARYLVGADGAGSWVRRTIGSEMEDLHGTQTSLIVDIEPFVETESLDPRRSFVRSSAGWPVTYIPIAPPMLRFERMLREEDDPREHERPEAVYELLRPWFVPGSYRIMRTDAYQWHSRLAKGWRSGRVLLAGDAAHTMPPMLGQGMCSGLRDATNLAWKLTDVVAGRSPEALLDTYESERWAQVRPLIEESARQANVIESTDFAPDVTPSRTEPHVIVMSQSRPPLGPGLLGDAEARTGVLAPQPASDAGARFDDLAGYRFAVYARPAVIDGVDDETRAVWADLAIVVLDLPSAERDDWLSAHACDAVLVRPDRYTFATTTGPEDLKAATMRLRESLGRGAGDTVAGRADDEGKVR